MSKPEEIRELSTSLLRPHPANDEVWGECPVDELVDSIRATGHITPLWVHDEGDGSFVVLGGCRRLKACRALGVESVPCSIIDGLDEEQKLAALFSDNSPNRRITDESRARAAFYVCDHVERGQGRAGRLAHLTGMSLDLAKKYVAFANAVDQAVETGNEPEQVKAEAIKVLSEDGLWSESAREFKESLMTDSAKERLWTKPIAEARKRTISQNKDLHESKKSTDVSEVSEVSETAVNQEEGTTSTGVSEVSEVSESPTRDSALHSGSHDDPLWANYSAIVKSFPPSHAEILGSLLEPVNLRVFFTGLGYNPPKELQNWTFKDLKLSDGRTPRQALTSIGVPESVVSSLLT